MMDDVPLAAPMTHKFYNHHLPDNTNILLQNIQLVQVQGTKFPTYRHIIISTVTGIGGDADAAK